MRAGQMVIELLRAEGVTHVFGLVGATTNSILSEMHGRTDIRFIDARHEQGAAFMAYGFVRASGRPAVCLTTAGPGASNMLTGIALAYKGQAPVIALAGSWGLDHEYRDGFQTFDLVTMFKPVTKLSLQVNKTRRLPELFHHAFRTALTGKPGPVFLDIPKDLLEGQTVGEEVLPPEAYRVTNTRIDGDPKAIEHAVTILADAQRPMMLVGGGVIDSEASKEAVDLAELLDMGIVPSYGHNDAVPNSHALYVGPPGRRGCPEAAEAMRKADVILALGTRISQLTSQWAPGFVDPKARIVQVEIDAQEIGRNYPVAVGILGDAKAVTQQLLEALRRRYPEGISRPDWRAEIDRLVISRRDRLEAEARLAGMPIKAQRVYRELAKVLPRDCMVTIDAGITAGLGYDRLHFEEPRTFFTYAHQGGVGMGYCVGLGTKLGRPDRAAVSISGDGSFLLNSQEINTAVRWRIPLVHIVLNNGCWGAEKAHQKRAYDGRYVGVDIANPRFDKLAEVYGARGFYVERPDEIGVVIREALSINVPSVIEIPVEEDLP
ncbi:thiamine pyrophosphate-binding protein [Chloroflexota bacterium]